MQPVPSAGKQLTVPSAGKQVPGAKLRVQWATSANREKHTTGAKYGKTFKHWQKQENKQPVSPSTGKLSTHDTRQDYFCFTLIIAD